MKKREGSSLYVQLSDLKRLVNDSGIAIPKSIYIKYKKYIIFGKFFTDENFIKFSNQNDIKFLDSHSYIIERDEYERLTEEKIQEIIDSKRQKLEAKEREPRKIDEETIRDRITTELEIEAYEELLDLKKRLKSKHKTRKRKLVVKGTSND